MMAVRGFSVDQRINMQVVDVNKKRLDHHKNLNMLGRFVNSGICDVKKN